MCEGLDTLAEISINGTFLAKTDNMHRTWKFQAKKLLHPGKNEIQIVFRSVLRFIEDYPYEAHKKINYIPCGSMKGNQLLRKAHSMFGWDWGPQLPDMGIWRDIFIDSYEKAELSDLHIRQEHIDGKVFLSAETKVMLPEKAQDDEIAEAEYLVLPQSAESNARILKESVGNNDSTLAENADNLEVKITLQTPDGKQISFSMEMSG